MVFAAAYVSMLWHAAFMIDPTTISSSMQKKPSTRPQMSRILAMKRLQTPPVIEATMLTTAVNPCASKEEVMYGFRLDWTAENSDSTNWARYRLGTR
jgi:hypothetical protein